MPNEIVVHMIANAHLDPVWLWRWQRGSDEALATCRAACDLLDDYPDAVFTRGEAWVYEQVRSLDPALFERVRAHVEAGRWEVVGGWWVQPDVNLPAEEAILKSAWLGRAWFRRHLGVDGVPVAYNVDSFGHGAYLPRMLRRAGQRYYVMMRPGPGEMDLPSSLFRWRSPDGEEVLAFRIAGSYTCNGPRWGLEEHVRGAVAAAPAGVGHVMCFYGVGDHGGGPTRRAVEWIRAHRDFAPGIRLEFSSPSRFFDLVEPARETLPVVEGELQMHAVGCYSVCGALKRDVRRAELAAIDAGRLLDALGGEGTADPSADAWATERRAVEEAWEHICFNQFHDILPGSAVSEGIQTARAQIGAATTALDRATHTLMRRHAAVGARCEIEGHRLHVVNRSTREWAGLAEGEAWMDWWAWEHEIENAAGRRVPHQLVEASSLMLNSAPGAVPRFVFPVEIEPAGSVSLKIVRRSGEPAAPAGAGPAFTGGVLGNARLSVRFSEEGIAGVAEAAGGRESAPPGSAPSGGRELLAGSVSLACLEDRSDTWSHGLAGYEGPVRAWARFLPPVAVEHGPLRATVRLDGRVGGSDVRLFVSLCRDDPVVHVRLATNYAERLSLLKALVRPAGGIARRRDRVAGGWIARPLWFSEGAASGGPAWRRGREYPLHHAILLEGEVAVGIALPDTFAIDCDGEAARPTLIRNSLHAMDNAGGLDLAALPRLVERFGTDEGPQELRMALAFGAAATVDGLEALVERLMRPPHVWDDYRGGVRLERFEGE